jgi:hypothetical protein
MHHNQVVFTPGLQINQYDLPCLQNKSHAVISIDTEKHFTFQHHLSQEFSVDQEKGTLV